MVAEAWDDLDKADLVWMPAHCGEGAAGSKYKGDGSPLTISDIRGNQEADRLAKLAAESHRVPEAIRSKIACQAALISDTVKWIGRAAHLANNQDSAPHRDVDTTKAATAAAKKHRAAARLNKPKPTKKKVATRPQALGGH